ncbi:hypothetical protein BH09MYX1_BH09MYX1_57120 [soil metagenome]
MTRTSILVSLAFTVACGGGAATKGGADTPAATTSSTATTSAAPSIDLRVWTSYEDFSAHGYNGSGEFYRREAGGWASAHCSATHVADAEANASKESPTCGAWTPVAKDKWSALDRIKADFSEVFCEKSEASCKELGLAAVRVR